MAARKIKLTMEGTLADSLGPVVDVDFNSVNVDLDLNITETEVVREYTIDVDAGSYTLNLDFKNDDVGRDLHVKRVDVANDGTTYERLILTGDNTSNFDVQQQVGWRAISNPDFDPDSSDRCPVNPAYLMNPDYDPNQPKTDEEDFDNGDEGSGGTPGYVWNSSDPGANPFFQHSNIDTPSIAYVGGVKSITVTFS